MKRDTHPGASEEPVLCSGLDPVPFWRRRRRNKTNEMATSDTAATPPTTGTATQDVYGGLASAAWSASADEIGVLLVPVLRLERRKDAELKGRDREETGSGIVGRAGLSISTLLEVAGGDGTTAAELLAPVDGVKNTAPPLVTGAEDGAGIVVTPGMAGIRSHGFVLGGPSAAMASVAESVRGSAATALELVTTVLR